jgi:hypothetical protein
VHGRFVRETTSVAAPLRNIAWVVLLVCLLIGCAAAPVGDPVINGFAVGPATTKCDWTTPDPGCVTTIDIAARELEVVDQGHPRIRQAIVHDVGTYGRSPNPRVAFLQTGGRLQVVVFDYADGTRQAIGVSCRGRACVAVAHL